MSLENKLKLISTVTQDSSMEEEINKLVAVLNKRFFTKVRIDKLISVLGGEGFTKQQIANLAVVLHKDYPLGEKTPLDIFRHRCKIQILPDVLRDSMPSPEEIVIENMTREETDRRKADKEILLQKEARRRRLYIIKPNISDLPYVDEPVPYGATIH